MRVDELEWQPVESVWLESQPLIHPEHGHTKVYELSKPISAYEYIYAIFYIDKPSGNRIHYYRKGEFLEFAFYVSFLTPKGNS